MSRPTPRFRILNVMKRQAAARPAIRPARLALRELDSIWFQVTGLLCNLECTHCLVESSPRNESLAFLDRETVRRRLGEAEALGVKEIYFTGGEPFLHPEMTAILADALAVGPSTVLTNGTLVTERLAAELAALARASRYSLEIRVSLDHPDPLRNDAVRGPGTHAKAVRAVLHLERAGLLPIVTATEYLFGPPAEASAHEHRGPGRSTPPESTYRAFLRVLREAGVHRPRVKVMPVFHVGKLEDPAEDGPVTGEMMEGLDPLLLQCASTRVVTAAGIYACPILVGKAVALTGRGALADALGAVPLAHHACRTCYETGMTCGNW
jgi:uncharacterized Fe-S cluster-containing radical SAM superfamily protein